MNVLLRYEYTLFVTIESICQIHHEAPEDPEWGSALGSAAAAWMTVALISVIGATSCSAWTLRVGPVEGRELGEETMPRRDLADWTSRCAAQCSRPTVDSQDFEMRVSEDSEDVVGALSEHYKALECSTNLGTEEVKMTFQYLSFSDSKSQLPTPVEEDDSSMFLVSAAQRAAIH